MGDFLKANLSALRQVDRKVAEAVWEARPPSDWEAGEGKSGVATLRVSTPDGRRVFLHSRYDPEEEARRILSRYDLGHAHSFIVLGFGLGYHVEELLRGKRDLLAVVIERDARILRLALERRDFSGLLGSGKLVLLVDPSKAELLRRLHGYTVRLFAGMKGEEEERAKGPPVIVHPASAQLYPEFYRIQMQNVLDFMEHGSMSLRTAMNIPVETKHNLLMNFGAYVYQPGLEILRGRFKGYPAVVVTAGPSLAKNIDQLREIGERAVIIAVGTIYKTLLSRGVAPHFVTTLDYHVLSSRYLEGAGDYGSVLVGEPKASHEAVDAFKGRKLFCGNEFLDSCVEGLGVRRAGIKGGATVAHLAFYLADYVGADPIILVGQDLSFPHGVTHIPGSAIHKGWYPELNRFNTMEMKEWEQIARMRMPPGAEKVGENVYRIGGVMVSPLVRKVEDVFGNEVYTDAQMYSYLLHFEREFALTPARVIDATEGGVRKAGAEAMTLREAASVYCGGELPEELLEFKLADFFSDVPSKGEVARELRGHIEEVEEAKGLYCEALEVLGEIKERFEDRAAVKRLIPKVHGLRERINARRRIGGQLSEIGQKEEFRKHAHDLEISGRRLEGAEKQRRQLERDMDYLGGLSKAADVFVKMLEEGIGRVEEFDLGEVKRLWGAEEGRG